MKMSQITITINSREYPIACEDGQELRIMQLADILDEKAKLLAADASQISESLLLAMVGLLLADEISELKKGAPAVVNDTGKIKIAPDEMQSLDDSIAERVQDINNEIKKLANALNSL